MNTAKTPIVKAVLSYEPKTVIVKCYTDEQQDVVLTLKNQKLYKSESVAAYDDINDFRQTSDREYEIIDIRTLPNDHYRASYNMPMYLREYLKGKTLTFVLTNGKSKTYGYYRYYRVLVVENGQIEDITTWISKVTIFDYDPEMNGIEVQGNMHRIYDDIMYNLFGYNHKDQWLPYKRIGD